MPLTRTQARDEILQKVKQVADGLSDFVVIYDSTRQDIPDENSDPLPTWARVVVQHIQGQQSSLSNLSNKRRYTKRGLLTIQLFTPTGDGLQKSDQLVEQFEAAVRNVSTPNGVWFRNVRSSEVGEDGPWFQTNILAEFEYDQVG